MEDEKGGAKSTVVDPQELRITNDHDKQTKKEVWLTNFMTFKKFYEEHGHLTLSSNIPDRDRLTRWLTYQRHYAKKLGQSQLELLESIAYRHSKPYRPDLNKKWDTRYHQLKKLHAEYSGVYTVKDKSLASWLARQKRKLAAEQLSPEKKSLLTDLNITPAELRPGNKRNTKSDYVWSTQYQKLKDFHAKYGHCKVPRNWNEDKSLGAWVFRQRIKRKDAKVGLAQLTNHQVSLLDKLDFEWEVQKSRKVCGEYHFSAACPVLDSHESPHEG